MNTPAATDAGLMQETADRLAADAPPLTEEQSQQLRHLLRLPDWEDAE